MQWKTFYHSGGKKCLFFMIIIIIICLNYSIEWKVYTQSRNMNLV